jgi:hypothetical protein
MGEESHQYFCQLLKQRDSYWFRTVRIILGLREQYGQDAVNKSLQRALYYSVTDVGTIRSILEKKLYLIPTEPKLLDRERSESSPTRDLDYYTTSL